MRTYLINRTSDELLNSQVFDNYFNYISNNQKKIPKTLFDFAYDKHRYDFNNTNSLHDAWIVKMGFNYGVGRNDFQDLVVELVNAFNTFIFSLKYSNVIELKLSNNILDLKCLDWLIDEFNIDDNGFFNHYIKFDKGTIMIIKFKNFQMNKKSISHRE